MSRKKFDRGMETKQDGEIAVTTFCEKCISVAFYVFSVVVRPGCLEQPEL